jgi:hypothetical protein
LSAVERMLAQLGSVVLTAARSAGATMLSDARGVRAPTLFVVY